MMYFLLMLLLFPVAESKEVFDFNKNCAIDKWYIVDDVVMGGKSSGSFQIDSMGHGVFSGSVSLENNGGFSSIRYQAGQVTIDDFTKISIILKGDGKDYQFRLKAQSNDYYTYVSSFSTSGEWQEIEIELGEMYPSFRGRKLDQPNFDHAHFEELGFLISNKKNETFRLLIDRIELK